MGRKRRRERIMGRNRREEKGDILQKVGTFPTKKVRRNSGVDRKNKFRSIPMVFKR